MQVKDSIKKVGAVAGSALMVGMTMGSAATLADFPQPFVGEDGTVASQVVVGQNAKTADVVGAINVAAALGQSAVQTETKTETVSVSGGSFGWSASNGETLDTRNDNLYFGDSLDTVRNTLTSDHLDTLADTTFQDDAGDEYDIEYYLYPGSQSFTFGQPSDADDSDPFLYVDNPASPDATTNGGNLFTVQANFQDTINFTDPDVAGEEIELFGTDYTVSEDTVADELVLYGSSQTVSLANGESGTVTINGNEHTITVNAVNDNGVVYQVDGGARDQDGEGTTFTIEGQEVRIDNIINLVDDSGSADFEIGSNELHLFDGEAIEDEDDDDIDGTYVNFDADSGSNGPVDDVSSLTIGFGSHDDDREYVMAGESYAHPQFGNFEFHFGGLNPDAGEGAGENVGEIAFATSGDDVVTADFTADSGEDATVEWAYDSDLTNAALSLADGDGENFIVEEGADVREDQFVATDAGDFSHLWEVTSIDRDDTGDLSSTDEATIQMQDVVTGTSIEVDLDATNAGGAGNASEHYGGTEVIDGQTYQFSLEGSNLNDPDFQVAWDNGASFNTGSSYGVSVGNSHSIYPALDTDSGAALAFTESVTPVSGASAGSDGTGGNVETQVYDTVFEMPSTQSTDAKVVNLTVDENSDSTSADDATYTLNVDVGNDDSVEDSNSTSGANGAATVSATVGETSYRFRLNDVGQASIDLSAAVDDDQDASTDGGALGGPSALVVEPEDDGDQEDAYVHVPGTDTGNEEIEAGGSAASVMYTDGYSTTTMESNDDMEVDYSPFGTYTEQDTDDAGSFTLYVPNGQSAAGAAFTNPEGDLTAGGGGSSTATVEYTDIVGMGALPDMAMLDSQVSSSVRQSQHLILVGGPAVNTLVADLASNGDTWTQQEWADNHDNEALLQVVDDAFATGQHAMIVAGHSAGDTRAAARYVSNYADHEQALADAGRQLTLTEADYPTN